MVGIYLTVRILCMGKIFKKKKVSRVLDDELTRPTANRSSIQEGGGGCPGSSVCCVVVCFLSIVETLR